MTAPVRRVRRRSADERAVAAGEPFPQRRRGRRQLPFEREIGRRATVALVLALTLLGAAIRVAVDRGLSIDEILTVDQAHRSFGGLISLVIHRGTRPPLYPVLEWCAVHILGDGSFAVRLPSLVAGIALVPVIALLAAELFDRLTGIIAALLACVAPILVWYSQDASSYMLVALFGTLTVLGAVRATRRGEVGDWVLYVLAAALTVWSDWSGILIVLASQAVLVAAWMRRRESDPLERPSSARWGLASLALLAQLIVLGVLFASQLHHDGGLAGVMNVAASGVSFYSSVSNISWGLFGFHPAAVTSVLSAVWPLAMLGSLLLVGRGSSRNGWLLLACVAVPALGVFVLGLVAPGTYDVRYAIAAVPPLVVLIARIVVAFPRGRAGRALVGLGAVLLFTGALVDQQLDLNNPRRFGYGPALAQVQHDAAGSRGHAVVFYEPTQMRVVFARDAPSLTSTPLSPHLPTRRQDGSVFIVTSSAGSGAPSKLLDRDLGALRATRRLVRFTRYPGVNVWWFR